MNVLRRRTKRPPLPRRHLSTAAVLPLVAVLATSSIPGQAGAPGKVDPTTLANASATTDGTVPEAIPSDPPAVATPEGATVTTRLLPMGRPSVDQIPAAALAAYQRAAVVIADPDPTCGLDWELLAALGQVESNHGQYGGNHLYPDGVARPGVFGPRLNGRHDTSRVVDTDGGELDHDARFDRAVGPMQFIPSTWAVVVVDGDGDGRRDPQDIDDAALAAAVYLCSGSDDLSTVTGERVAVHRYNHSRAYVDLVLAVKHAYESGFATSAAPTGSVIVPAVHPLHVPDTAIDQPPSGSDHGPRPASTPTTTPPTPTVPVTTGQPTDPAPTDPAPIDPAPTDPAPTDPAPTDPAPTDPASSAEPTVSVEEVLTAQRDECVGGGVDSGDRAALASCLADRLVLQIAEDGTITGARQAGDTDVPDPDHEAAEVQALTAWLDRQAQ